MASLLSEEAFGSDEEQSERCGSYSLSADISESESCSSSFSCRRFETECGASSSMTSSPRPIAGNFIFPGLVMLSMIGGKDVVVWDEKKPEKPETDLSDYSGGHAAIVGSVLVTNLKSGFRKGEWDCVQVGTTDSVMGLPKELSLKN